jgi:hypothetical protein
VYTKYEYEYEYEFKFEYLPNISRINKFIVWK